MFSSKRVPAVAGGLGAVILLGLGHSKPHGAVVPIYGSGPGSKAILGTTDHTDLFDIMRGR